MELEKAVALLEEHTKEITDSCTLPVGKVYGHVLAEDVCAMHNQPPFPRSPLDGYAVRGEDTTGATPSSPVTLSVIDEADAGHVSEKTVAPGEAVRIMTGAPVPAGADCVIRQEDTDCGEENVRIRTSVAPFENYCREGEDFRKGDLLLPGGMYLGAAECGILASAGREEARVVRPVRALVVSTGDELAKPGDTLLPGKIYDSNLYMIDAALRSFGAEVTGSFVTGDDAAACAALIRKHAEQADLIVTSGGVSVGKKDILHEVIELLPAKKLFWQVDIKPGSPMLAALYDEKPLLCVSGNPYGAFVSMHLLVRRVVAKMSRRKNLVMHTADAEMAGIFPKPGRMRRFVRAHYEQGRVTPTSGSNSNGVLSTLAGCNCLMEIPEDSAPVEAGTRCRVHLL
ncbi:MAG: molybdopterin molybdotransferase MoeA [Lachnospiraceae bacterium]|nr:molybdopterin molybdotransferase MoeA [Lachnospiraceae bacterium]